MPQYGMVIDLRKCVGCYACVTACKAENATPKGVTYNRVVVKEEGKYPQARMTFTPQGCMHCSNAPCEKACPTKATYTTPEGIVLVDKEKCIGCKACIPVCPYEARTHIAEVQGYFSEFGLNPYEEQGYKKHKENTVEKCKFCEGRVKEGKQPACVTACTSGARAFGDLSDSSSEVAKAVASDAATRMKLDAGTEPKVYYLQDK